MAWTWNKDYKDLGQVEEFYPAYLAVYEPLHAAGQTPYNDLFKGRIPGIEGDREDTAIYLLQQLRSVREMQAQIAEHREAGWRDFDPAEIDGGPVRFAGVAEYCGTMAATVSGNGKTRGSRAMATRSVMVLAGRARTNGHLAAGKLLVKD